MLDSFAWVCGTLLATGAPETQEGSAHQTHSRVLRYSLANHAFPLMVVLEYLVEAFWHPQH